MSGASWNLQTAIYGLLVGLAPAIAAGGVFDAVPDAVTSETAPDNLFPIVQIGATDTVPADVDQADGTRDDGVVETITLHIWSRYRGQKEAKEIMQRIRDLLHDTELTVTGRSSALCTVTMMHVLQDPDGKTWHGVMAIETIHRK